VVRLFHVYYPLRSLVLLAGELLVVFGSFWAATLFVFGADSYLVLNYENGFYKIIAITGVTLLFSHYFDLYEPFCLLSKTELYTRLLMVLGSISVLLAGIGYFSPRFMLGRDCFLLGLLILTMAWFGWRSGYSWLVQWPYLRERVYVLGTGEMAEQLVQSLRNRPDLGIEIVGWAGALGDLSLEMLAENLAKLGGRSVHRVIVAMSNRRGTIPVKELLNLRLSGVKVEDATALMEKTMGKIQIDGLFPSWLIFSEGFRLNPTFLLLQRLVSIVVSLACLLACLPLIPLIALAIKISSPGPVLYRQKRVGMNGAIFDCYKFRTMRADAEADTGPTWAEDDDPRITAVGRFLRLSRLDEIPQLWNVFRGDMAFVGPRPERPEFVQWLSREIPYYHLRHFVRPGITGWAQIRHKYGNSVQDAKEKLQYDLFYIKNLSLGLDLSIVFMTIKIVMLGRGAQ